MKTKKIYRNTEGKMLGGVASGFADYFEIDPTIIRLIFILTAFLGGGGILAYLICWIIIPKKSCEVTEG